MFCELLILGDNTGYFDIIIGSFLDYVVDKSMNAKYVGIHSNLSYIYS